MTPHVLVADDDPEMLDIVSLAVEEHGARVVRARSGAELIQALADEGPFDLIITDVSMPWMSGLQVAHAARTAGVATPVIVITGMKQASVESQFEALGGSTVLLHKPFDLAELHGAIELLLAGRSGAHASP